MNERLEEINQKTELFSLLEEIHRECHEPPIDLCLARSSAQLIVDFNFVEIGKLKKNLESTDSYESLLFLERISVFSAIMLLGFQLRLVSEKELNEFKENIGLVDYSARVEEIRLEIKSIVPRIKDMTQRAMWQWLNASSEDRGSIFPSFLSVV